MTYYEIEAMVKDLAEKDEVVKVILENICGDGYNAYARAYEIIKAINKRTDVLDHIITTTPTANSFVKAVNISKDGRTFDALLDKQRMLVYKDAITCEMIESLGYSISEVE